LNRGPGGSFYRGGRSLEGRPDQWLLVSEPTTNKIGITISQRFANRIVANYRIAVVAGPLTSESAKTAFVTTGPYKTLPVVSYRLPFLVKTAIREFTICTMWSGPIASELSEGLRTFAAPRVLQAGA
jgi:hypothetical protein